MHLVYDTRGQRVRCCRCRKMLPLAVAYADLDGVPWQAYDCGPCAPVLLVANKKDAR